MFHTCTSARAYRIALADLVGGPESTLGSAKRIYSGSLAMAPKKRGSASLIHTGGIKAVPTEEVQTLSLVTIPEQQHGTTITVTTICMLFHCVGSSQSS